ncbi:MAG TPA: D-alanine--D-alanine ligase [Bacilli bacterium]
MSGKIRVGVIYGGRSGEHDVSLATALSVINAFDRAKYEIVPLYITRTGEWNTGAQIEAPVNTKEELMLKPAAGRAKQAALPQIYLSGTGEDRAPAKTGSASGLSLDVVFPLLHGTYGEDGTVQGLLEMVGIPYVGAGVLASAVGMDKVAMKKIFAQEGLPQCLYRHFTRFQWEHNKDYYIMEIEVSLGYPCFVKPANLGSSVGISKAKNRAELLEAVATALRFDRKVIVEEAVDAREIEVGVLGNEDPKASVPGEIRPSSDFYDYKAKYIDGKSAIIIPAELTLEQTDTLRNLAVRAFRAIDGSGLSRVDFFLRKADGAFLINEINTMPGFTPFSMYPLLWKQSGISYPELIDELIRLALERYNDKQKIQYGFEV